MALETPKKEDAYREVRIQIVNFLSTFEIENSLWHPHIYRILEETAREIIKSVLEGNLFSLYLRELLGNQMKLEKRGREGLEIDSSELFLLRVLCEMSLNEEEKKGVSAEVLEELDENFPCGLEFAKIIEYYSQKEHFDALSLQQCLLMSEMQINCDQAGKQEIANLLMRMTQSLVFQEIFDE
jgi:hypothetical protein